MELLPSACIGRPQNMRSSGGPPLTDDGHGAQVGVRLDLAEQLDAIHLRHAHILRQGADGGGVCSVKPLAADLLVG